MMFECEPTFLDIPSEAIDFFIPKQPINSQMEMKIFLSRFHRLIL